MKRTSIKNIVLLTDEEHQSEKWNIDERKDKENENNSKC